MVETTVAAGTSETVPSGDVLAGEPINVAGELNLAGEARTVTARIDAAAAGTGSGRGISIGPLTVAGGATVTIACDGGATVGGLNTGGETNVCGHLDVFRPVGNPIVTAIATSDGLGSGLGLATRGQVAAGTGSGVGVATRSRSAVGSGAALGTATVELRPTAAGTGSGLGAAQATISTVATGTGAALGTAAADVTRDGIAIGTGAALGTATVELLQNFVRSDAFTPTYDPDEDADIVYDPDEDADIVYDPDEDVDLSVE